MLFLLIILVGLSLYLPYLGSYGPLDPTDSFFLESAREMVEKNEFLVPMFNYKLWLDKPVLCFWFIAAFYKTFGITTLAGRLPSAIASISTSLGIFITLKDLVNTKTRLLASLIYLSFPLIAIYSRTPLTDSILTGFMSIVVISMFKVIHSNTRWDRFIFYIFLALAILCKGPIAMVLIAILWLSQYFIYGINPFQELKTKFIYLPEILLFLAVLLPWYIMASIETHGEFFYKFFIEQNFGRMIGHINHQNPVWFYIPVIAAGFLPYNMFLVYLKEFWQLNKEKLKCDLSLFSFTWSGICFVLFSLISTKLPTYIEPGSIGLVICCAIVINYLDQKQDYRLLKIISLTLSLASFVLALNIFIKSKLLSLIILPIRPVLLICSACFLGVIFIKDYYKFYLFIFSFLILEASVLPSAFMSYYKIRQTPFNKITNIIINNKGEAGIIFAEQPSIQYYLKRKVPSLKSAEEMQNFVNQKCANKYLIVPQEVVSLLKWADPIKYTFIVKEDKWLLYKINN